MNLTGLKSDTETRGVELARIARVIGSARPGNHGMDGQYDIGYDIGLGVLLS